MSTIIYKRVPDELKLMIWREAIPSSGVHYLKIVPQLAGYHYQLEYQLEIQPMQLKSDTSTWIERWNLFRADDIAQNAVQNWATKTNKEEQALWVARFLRKRRNVERTDIAMVHAANDIVCLQFSGASDFDINFLNMAQTKAKFQGLRKIALNFRAPESGTGWVIRPFQCLCPDITQSHRGSRYCPIALIDFLRLFPSMKCFYFIYRINAKQIDFRSLSEKTSEGKAVKKTADEAINETLAKLKEIAERENLETITDMKRTYYEVRQQDSALLVDHSELCQTIQETQRIWAQEYNLQLSKEKRASLAKTKFKILICRDRLGEHV